jgi:L-ribulose-5-phosphate 3-epimerase
MHDQRWRSSRRKFLSSVAGAGVMATIPKSVIAEAGGAFNGRLPIIYFSKHLQWLDWEHMAETAKELGSDGLDVTVRQGGHVEPSRVQEDLPKVAKIVRAAGLEIPMITAGIVDANSPDAEAIIRTAAEAGISRYRWG